jgi:hypothetical protein
MRNCPRPKDNRSMIKKNRMLERGSPCHPPTRSRRMSLIQRVSLQPQDSIERNFSRWLAHYDQQTTPHLDNVQRQVTAAVLVVSLLPKVKTAAACSMVVVARPHRNRSSERLGSGNRLVFLARRPGIIENCCDMNSIRATRSTTQATMEIRCCRSSSFLLN